MIEDTITLKYNRNSGELFDKAGILVTTYLGLRGCEAVGTSVEDLVQLRKAGYTTDDIVELRKKEII